MRRRFLHQTLAAALAGTVPAARAAIGGLAQAAHGDSSPEWDKLRGKLFGDRQLVTGNASQVRIEAPLRAAYGASVPIKISSRLPQRAELHVQRLWLLIDKNPSPLALELEVTPQVGQADFETRVRVDEYSHVRVVQQLSNGELHTDSRYVKTSGGCSAPPNRDAPHLIGRTQFRLPEGLRLSEPTTAEVSVVHPNDTGFELNQQTVMYIPPHFVRTLQVSFDGDKLFDADMDFSISENPSLRFMFVPQHPGELRAEVEDSKQQRFSAALRVG